MRVDIYHNILWSRYKGAVFSKLYGIAEGGVLFKFCQIAETESGRISLSGVDLSYHNYPYRLLFSGSLGDVSVIRLIVVLFLDVFKSDSDLVVIPGYHRWEYWSMLFAAIVTGKRRAVFCDSTQYDKPASLIKGLAKRVFLRSCHGFFCYGSRSKDYLISLGAPANRIYFRKQAAALPSGYDPKSVLRSRVDNLCASQVPVFLYAGRLSEEKSLDVLLLAFSKVIKSIPSAKLRVVGSGPLQAYLVDFAKRLFIQDHVCFVGSMSPDDLALEYSNATCFVLPSRSEPWGLVVNEALSYGCPVVVSNSCGCVPELVLEGITGYEFPVDDSDALADRMLKVAENFTDVEAVARRCLDVISDYSPDNAARQIFQGCKEILKKDRR